VSVAVPVPFLDALTYAVPEGTSVPAIGSRVRVPLGSREVVGCVVGVGVAADGATDIKVTGDVLDAEPLLPASIVELCRWVAEYYLAGIGDVIGVALPPGARRRASGFKVRRVAAATTHGLSVWRALVPAPHMTPTPTLTPTLTPTPTPTPTPTLTPKQLGALGVLASVSGGLSLPELRERGVSADVVSRLAKHGLAVYRDERDERDPFERAVLASVPLDASRTLTGEQQRALDALSALTAPDEFHVALLHGVTGSGKTEIYLRLADDVRRQGKQALLLVPEIGLTPSVSALLRAAFGDRVAIQHSGLSDGERHDQWQRIRHGLVDVVVGTRSAVFAPLTRLGLIIVDEEHDSSYKQEEAPRYHGRDVAIVRARAERALVVLGSATPSMETYHHAVTGKYSHLAMERRVLDRPLADVRLVNMRDEYADGGAEVVVSRDLAEAIEQRLSLREQVLVLLNRRGFATSVFCRQCGDTFECPNCSVSLTVHRARGGWRARCHYCNYSADVPRACRKCAAPYLEHAGFGTEKVEAQLRERFPEARIARIDRDAIRRRGALASLLMKFADGDIDVLVGTQMIAKGHDFPRVTLVGVISADVGLGVADFRAGERTFQLLTQVAGRAGRGERTGEAIVQTLYPEHYSIQLACRQAYPAFFEKELAYRRAMRYPPLVAMINVVVRGRTFGEAMQTAGELARRLEAASSSAGFHLLGPAPAPLGKLKGEHRVQLFLKGTRRGPMRVALEDALDRIPEIRRRLTVDVDPVNVL
jgi:primosomal protein N' (replication factor Y)